MPSAKSAKRYENGVEVTTSMNFKGWQPGFEYTKNICLKNLNTKSVKLTYEIPKSRFFATLYPTLITLSPGTTFNLPVTFKPLEKVNYEDSINFQFQDTNNAFKVPLVGKLPQVNLEFAKSLDFGFCNAFEVVSKEIKLDNISELDTFFDWDVRLPFIVEPSNGVIKAKSSTTLLFSVNVMAALVINGKAICRFGASVNDIATYKVIELSAIGKYPYVQIESDRQKLSNEVQLTFDDIPFGKSSTQYITIRNMTPVKTSYFIERDTNVPLFDFSFHLPQSSGMLEPNGSQKIPIIYTPNLPDQKICDYFNVYTAGKVTKSKIFCFGTSKGPSVVLEPRYLDFGQFDISQTVPRTFRLINKSDTEMPFQFDVDCNQSSFLLSETCGTLKVGESKLIQVVLKPQYAIIYYKKLSCLIPNHDVLNIELFGTGHCETIKPALMNYSNLKNYYKLMLNNLSFNSPEQLMEMSVENRAIFELLNSDDVISDVRNDTNYEEYINDSYHTDTTNSKIHVSIDNPYVDFGSIPNIYDDLNKQKSIQLTNNTRGKVYVCWNTGANNGFSISPDTCEIPPMKSYSFRITFKPDKTGQYYNSVLEGYAIYKSLCDYSIVNPKFVVPSWCINVNCSGHTFHPSEEHFLPRYNIDTDNLLFPTTIIGIPTYRTLLIKNTANNYPINFDLDNDLNSSWFVKPRKGIIKPNEHQVFLFKFVPKQESHIIEKTKIRLNVMDSFARDMLLICTAETARLSLPNDGVLYFKPTCKGNYTTKSYEIVNNSRTTVFYEWKLPYECKGLFEVDKVIGSILPYEKLEFLWKFTPQKFEKNNIKVRLLAWIGDNRNSSICYNLRLVSSCTTGALLALENYKDYGSIVVGSSLSSELVLVNNNDCALDYELFVKQTVNENSANFKHDRCVLELEETTGKIEARSRKIIRCRVRPVRCIQYQFTVEYKIIYPNSEEDTTTSRLELLCNLIASGVYPKLSIVDIKAVGSASNLSKDYLWRLFSLDTLNSSMNCEPDAAELMYSIATRQDVNRRIVNQPKVMLDFNFNAAPVGSADTEVALFLENTGVVPTEWTLLFPKDLQIELEYWSQNGSFTEEELQEMKVQDNKLFTISPKQGHLEPGETVQIQLIYKHAFTGQNKLPILFKIARGREIMINLTGVTVPSLTSYVYLPSNRYSFLPVQIGLLEYPVQVFELYNGGDMPARVELDISQLENVATQNYSHTILECLTDNEIVIQPGTSYSTKWRFSPLEAKTYTVDVTIKVEGGETNIITFTCIGYDSRKLNNFKVKSLNHEDIPNKQLFMLPNQIASLSLDRIIFGDVPLFSRERRLIFVKNNSTEHQILFNWHVTDPEHIKFIRIQPSRGSVPPGDSKLCKITFLSKSTPFFYNLDLICEIKNETEVNKYKRELNEWEYEQKRQWEEFRIDDTELDKRLKEGVSRIEIKNSEEPTEKPSSQLSMHNFKTIPPLLANSYINETAITKVRRLRKEKKLWKKPTPPSPYLLHLNVIARTHYAADYYQASDINDESSKFIDGLLGSVAEMGPGTMATSKPIDSQASSIYQSSNNANTIPCYEDEFESITFILSDLLRSLISDNGFQNMVLKLKSEPIPYFLQYSQKVIGGELTNRYSNRTEILDDVMDSTNRRENMPPLESTYDTTKLHAPLSAVNDHIPSNHTIKPTEKSDVMDVSSRINQDRTADTHEEGKVHDITQKIKISPIFSSFVENILENTLINIVNEAFNNEFNMTSRPRLIALPPKLNSNSLNQFSQTSFVNKPTEKSQFKTLKTQTSLTTPPPPPVVDNK